MKCRAKITTSANQGGSEGTSSGKVRISMGNPVLLLIANSCNAAGRSCLSGVWGMHAVQATGLAEARCATRGSEATNLVDIYQALMYSWPSDVKRQYSLCADSQIENASQQAHSSHPVLIPISFLYRIRSGCYLNSRTTPPNTKVRHLSLPQSTISDGSFRHTVSAVSHQTSCPVTVTIHSTA